MPTVADYTSALLKPELAFADPQLRQGTLERNALGVPIFRVGNFGSVCRIKDPESAQSWAVKLFKGPAESRAQRYAAITQYLDKVQLPFLIACQYQENGIQVGGTWYPLLKMHWVEGQTLHEFLQKFVDNPRVLNRLSQLWFKLAQRLKEAHIVHGDLQANNILIVKRTNPDSLRVVLVDYDGMVVPGLESQQCLEFGHVNFQHPNRSADSAFQPRVDCFSHLVIYTALRALANSGRSLWERFDRGEGLLFQSDDFKNPEDSELMRLLSQSNDPEVSSLAGHLILASRVPLDKYPCLYDLLDGEKVRPPSRADAFEPPKTPEMSVPPLAPNLDLALDSVLGGDGAKAIADSLHPEKTPHLDENVQFTVYRPRAIQPEKWYTMLAFAHLSEKPIDAPADEPDPVVEVKRRAEKALDHIEAYQPVTQDSLQAVPRQGELTFLPEIDGVDFNPPRRVFLWQETVHQEEFRLRAASRLDGAVARGRLSVFLGSILLADVPLAIRVSREPEPAKKLPMETSAARPYRKIFASYSHKDLAIVEQFERHAKVLGDEYLRDWIHLRAGEVWNERLKELINEADIFQLFWSTNSMTSSYVRQEWEHALSLKRPNFIRPTYWEEPLPTSPADKLPPEELSRLQFQRITFGSEPAREMKPDAGELAKWYLDQVHRNVNRDMSPAQPIPKPAGPQQRGPGITDSVVLAPSYASKPPEVPGYTIESMLGKGGIGTVYKAHQQGIDRDVALKVIPSSAPESGAQFRSEVPRLARLQHPNIVLVHDLVVGPEQTVMVTELVQGGSLAQSKSDYVGDPRGAARLVLQVADAVAYAHQNGILHCDLKPANILFRQGRNAPMNQRTPMVADFGLAGARKNVSGLTGAGVIIGTPVYMAPERLAGETPTVAADVYSLGAILYELLTGSPPFQGSAVEIVMQKMRQEPRLPRDINPRVPRDLEMICMRCLSRDPKMRYPSVTALALDLMHQQEGTPVMACAPSAAERVVKQMRRKPKRTLLLGLAILIAVGLLALGIFLFVRF